MIARLKGTLHPLDADRVIVDVGGVGYEVHVSKTTFGQLPAEGSTASLEIHTNVREDALQLFGFATRDEKAMFLRLNQVSGIGPKLALAILSGLDVPALANAIARGDVKRLTAISHVGKKTAERIVVELKDKIGTLGEGIVVPLHAGGSLAAPLAAAGPFDDAMGALISLGYKHVEAEDALSALPRDLTDTGDIVKRALKRLAGRAAR